jgi:citrate synthase
MTSEPNSPGGLAGVVAARTELSRIDGETGRLWYRGYDIHSLASSSSFTDVLYLLWYGALPTRVELIAFEGLLAAARQLPESVYAVLRELPPATIPISALRTVVSALGCIDPDEESNDREANLRKAARLVAQMPTAVAAQYRIRERLEPIAPDPELSHAAKPSIRRCCCTSSTDSTLQLSPAGSWLQRFPTCIRLSRPGSVR